MDFSSVERALQSLSRRHPALDECVLTLSHELIDPVTSTEAYLKGIMTLLSSSSSSSRWEPFAVGLYLAAELINQESPDGVSVYVDGPRVPAMVTTSTNSHETSSTMKHASLRNDLTQDQLVSLCGPLLQVCQEHLEHSEPRVRTLVAMAVGAHVRLACQLSHLGELQAQRRELHDSIITSLYRHLQMGRDEADTYSKSSAGALDDTTGWRALETNWQGLASYIVACGPTYLDEQTPDEKLMEACDYSCITHVNRHVRAAAIAVLEHLCLAAGAGKHSSLLTDPASVLRKTIVGVLKVTLADNWSQVRMAASVLCRSFWTSLQTFDNASPELIYPILIPRMCLNRFYLAQGVKLYSHDTWRIVFEKNGVELVAKYAGSIVRYYVKMCDADNHVVREAACQAVAELAQKIGKHPTFSENLAPFVPVLLQSLLMCFHDESWPVRDEACLACGTFCVAYPEECRPELKTLYERWTEQLTDQIWSVREDAGVALGDAVVAYPEIQSDLLALIQKNLPSARDQPALTQEKYKQNQNDIASHTDSQLYSCGSLAPKLRKGGAGRIGCGNCDVTRPKAPWEATDGCIYLLRELCIKVNEQSNNVEIGDETMVPLLTELADVCRVRHFPQGDDLRTTLWRNVPVIAKALGKQRFKRTYLQIFLELLMANLERKSASALSIHAAGQCAEELANFVGIAIF